MAILFDLDDTLLDDRGAQEAYLGELYANHRHELRTTQVEFQLAWRSAIDRHFPRYTGGEISLTEQRRARVRDAFERPEMSDADADEVVSEFLAGYEAAWRVFPEVTNVLNQLRGIPLGIITNGSAAQQRAKLQRTGILDRFSIVIISEEVGYAKPSPQIFLDACDAIGVVPTRCTFIGDSWELDIEGARGAGIEPIWMNRTALVRTSAATTSIGSLSELVERPELRALLGLDRAIRTTR